MNLITIFVLITLACGSLSENLTPFQGLEGKLRDDSNTNMEKRNKRQTTCPTVETSCVEVGQTCTPLEPSSTCIECAHSLEDCLFASTDANAQCECFSESVECYNNANNVNCKALHMYELCRDIFDSANISCSCGSISAAHFEVAQCKFPAFCHTSTSGPQCVMKKAVGSACSSSIECGSPSNDFLSTKTYDCLNEGTCALLPGWGRIGDSCTEDSDCAMSPEFITCESGICTGGNAGESCSTLGSTVEEDTCNFGFYCHGDVCEAQKALGEECTGTWSFECQQGMVCGVENKCQPYYTTSAGGNCTSTAQCELGLSCVDNTCTAPLTATTCDDDEDCSGIGAGICECRNDGSRICAGTGFTLSDSCKGAIQDLMTCATTNKCKSSASGMDEGTCLGRNCATEARMFARCVLSGGTDSTHSDILYINDPRCGDVPEPNGNIDNNNNGDASSSGSTIVATIFLAFIFAVLTSSF